MSPRIAVLLALLTCAFVAPSAHAATTFTVDVPTAGDASYGIIQVKVGKAGAKSKPGKDRAFASRVAGLNVDARTASWSKLRKGTKVYVAAAKVVGGRSNLRNLVVFITRVGKSGGPARAKMTFTIANATAQKGSFWVRKVDRRGKATIFQVRNIVSTAVGNWSRYLAVLTLARAARAAKQTVDVKGRFTEAHSAQTGTISLGGTRMNARARAMFNLIFGTIGDPLAYQAAKRSPIVTDFITKELKNTALAQKWATVAGALPLAVPDTYAAAAKQEAQFSKITKPRVSLAQVKILDKKNSTLQAAIETPRLPNDRTPGAPVIVQRDGPGNGTVTSDVPGIACPPTCSHFFTSGAQATFTAEADNASTWESWRGCTLGAGTSGQVFGKCRVEINTTTVAPTITVISTFGLKAANGGGTPPPGGGPPPSPGPAPTALDSGFGSGGSTLTPFQQGTTQLSAFGNDVFAQPTDGKLVVVGARERPGPTYDWAITRYTPDGALDPSFNPNSPTPGKLVLLEDGTYNGGLAGLVDGSGNIYVTGEHDSPANNAAIRVYQLDSTGAPTNYGGAGIAQLAVPGSNRSMVQGIAQQPDGKIVVAGSATIGNEQKVFLARFTTAGQPDNTFSNGNALFMLPDSACDDIGAISSCDATGIGLLLNGSAVSAIYVSGWTFGHLLGGRVFKLVPGSGQNNFAVDPSYGDPSTPGGAQTPVQGLVIPKRMLIRPNGEVVLAGEASRNPNNQCGIARLTGTGQPDPSFGSGGFGVIELANGCSIAGLALQDNGSFVFGASTLSAPYSGVLGRFTPNGAPDTSFVAGGATTVPSGGDPAFFNDLLLQGTKPVAAGGAMNPPHQFQIARYAGKE